MKTGRCGKAQGILSALAISVLAFLMNPGAGVAATGEEICANLGPGTGQIDPAGDADGDGFTNQEECDGNLPLLRMNANFLCEPSTTSKVSDPSGNPIAGYLHRFGADQTAMDRTRYLDPSGKDLFFVWKEPTSGTDTKPFGIADLGSSPLSYYNAGMNITTHQINLDQTCGKDALGFETRWVTGGTTWGQKAVLVEESLVVSTPLGGTSVGTPLTSGASTIYTQKIWNLVETNCNIGYSWSPSKRAICRTSTTAACIGTSCANSTTKRDNAKNSIFLEYVKNVINHEVSHASNLARPKSDTDGNHQPAESGFLMEKNIKLTTKNDIVFYISTQFNSTDPNYLQLTGPLQP